jgi:LacI family transcriptional regulator
VVTIHDVARRARVSIATVSHVINETRPVSDELQARVNQAMEELGYQPNRLARGLRRGETYTIGLIVSDIADPFFAEMARCIEDAGFERGYSVILCNSDRRHDKERFYAKLLIEKQVDGVIFGTLGTSTESIRMLQKRNIPLIVVDREVSDVEVDMVLVDNAQGGWLATQHLIDLGHRRIGCITGDVAITTFAQRVEGYRQALSNADLAIDETLIVYGSVVQDGGHQATHQLLSMDDPPTAIFASIDMLAIGVIQEAATMGRRVPDDLSVIGFDDIALAALFTPPLTTISQPKQDMGSLATEMLLERIVDPNLTARTQLLDTALVVRGTTAPPKPS